MQFQDEESLIRFVTTAKLEDWRERLYKRNAEAVQVHSQGQVFYKLDRLFPNEQPESKAHRILSFESITEPSFGRAANNVNRIFKNSSYTIEASEATLSELDQDNWEGSNFYTWFLDEWVKWSMKEDPNSRIAIYPKAYVDEGNPWVAFIASEFIKYSDAETVVFVSEEESEIAFDLEDVCISTKVFYDQSINRMNAKSQEQTSAMPKLKKRVKWPVYHVFQAGEGFYRIVQDKVNAAQYQFDFYPSKDDFLPVTDVGGEPSYKDVNKSFLHPFVAFGNLALLQHSQHTAVNFSFSFPRMSELELPCDAEGCNVGFIECDTEEDLIRYPNGRKPCLRCGGSGYTTSQSPYKIYKKKYDPQGVEGDDKALSIPMVEFYTPPVEVLAYSKQEWRDYLEMAETAVYIQQRVKTGNVEAAKSKEIDREDLYAFLSQVAKVFFTRLRFVIQAFENNLSSNPVQVTVNIPYSFAIVSEGDAFTELQTILASNIPVMIKANRVDSFVNKFISQASPIRRFLEVLQIADPLLYYNNAELLPYKIGGVITAEQLAIHVYSFPVLQRMYVEDKKIFLQETKTIVDRLNKELEAYKPKPQDLQTKFSQQPPQ